jgi:hypothetical protein
MGKASVFLWLPCDSMYVRKWFITFLLPASSSAVIENCWYLLFSAFHHAMLSNSQLLIHCHQNILKRLHVILILWTSYTVCVSIIVTFQLYSMKYKKQALLTDGRANRFQLVQRQCDWFIGYLRMIYQLQRLYSELGRRLRAVSR